MDIQLTFSCCTWQVRPFCGLRHLMVILCPDVLCNFVKEKKNVASQPWIVIDELKMSSNNNSKGLFDCCVPFYVSTTHPFSNMFWILPRIYVELTCLLLRKDRSVILTFPLVSFWHSLWSCPQAHPTSIGVFKCQHFGWDLSTLEN